MMNKKRVTSAMVRPMAILALGVSCVLMGSGLVGAGEIAPVDTLDTTSLGASVPTNVLAHARGGFQVNDASMSGIVSGNNVTFGAGSNVSFSNALGGNAFRNASGIVNVIQNNGSNVVIQNLVQLNLQFRR